MNKKTTGIIAYFGLIGWVIAYFAGDREGAKFHLNQALVLAVAEIIVAIISRFNGLIISIISSVLGILIFVCWLIAFIGACKDEERVAPLFGAIKVLK